MSLYNPFEPIHELTIQTDYNSRINVNLKYVNAISNTFGIKDANIFEFI